MEVGFAGYLSALVGVNLITGALAIIALVFIVNASGIRQSSIINIVFTLIEAGGLVFVIVAAFPYLGKVNYTELARSGANGIMAASALAFFAFIGFEEIVKLAEETEHPEKNIPRALFISSAIVIVLYSLVAVCAVSVLPYQVLGKSASPLADVIAVRFGKPGVIIISIIALFATSNTILSNMLGSSRVLLNMGKETKLFQLFSYVSPKRKTTLAALGLILVIMSAFAFIGSIKL